MVQFLKQTIVLLFSTLLSTRATILENAVPYIKYSYLDHCFFSNCQCKLLGDYSLYELYQSGILEDGSTGVNTLNTFKKNKDFFLGMLCQYQPYYPKFCVEELVENIKWEDVGITAPAEQNAIKSVANMFCISASNNFEHGDGYCLTEIVEFADIVQNVQSVQELLTLAPEKLGKLCKSGCVNELQKRKDDIITLAKAYAGSFLDELLAVFNLPNGINTLCARYEACQQDLIQRDAPAYYTTNNLGQRGDKNCYPSEQLSSTFDKAQELPSCGGILVNPVLRNYPHAHDWGRKRCRTCSGGGCTNNSGYIVDCYREDNDGALRCPTPQPTKYPTLSSKLSPTITPSASPTASPTRDRVAAAFLTPSFSEDFVVGNQVATLEQYNWVLDRLTAKRPYPTETNIALNTIRTVMTDSEFIKYMCSTNLYFVYSLLRNIQFSRLEEVFNYDKEYVDSMTLFLNLILLPQEQLFDLYCQIDEETGQQCFSYVSTTTDDWKASCTISNECSSCLSKQLCNSSGCVWNDEQAVCGQKIVVENRNLQEDLPISEEGLIELGAYCDPDLITRLVDTVSGENPNMIQIIQNELPAMCEKIGTNPSCIETLLKHILWDKLGPPYSSQTFINSINKLKPKICVQDASEKFCFSVLAQSYLSESTAPLSFCSTPCFDVMGGDQFLDEAQPVLSTVKESNYVGRELCVIPTDAPTTSPTYFPTDAPTLPPKPENLDKYCQSSCRGFLGDKLNLFVPILDFVSDSGFTADDVGEDICVTKAPTESPTPAPSKSPTTSPTDAPSTSPTLAPSDTPTSSPSTEAPIEGLDEAVSALVDNNLIEVLYPGGAETFDCDTSDLAEVATAVQSIDVDNIFGEFFFNENIISAVCKAGKGCAKLLFSTFDAKMMNIELALNTARQTNPTVTEEKVLEELRSVISKLVESGSYCSNENSSVRRLDTSQSCLSSYLYLFRHQSTSASRRLFNSERGDNLNENGARKLQGLADVIDIAKVLQGECNLSSLLALQNAIEIPADGNIGALIQQLLSTKAGSTALCFPDAEVDYTPKCPSDIVGALKPEILPDALQDPQVQEHIKFMTGKYCSTTDDRRHCAVEAFADAFAKQENDALFVGTDRPICRDGCYEALGQDFIDGVEPFVAAITEENFDVKNFTNIQPSEVPYCPKVEAIESVDDFCAGNEITSTCRSLESTLKENSESYFLFLSSILGKTFSSDEQKTLNIGCTERIIPDENDDDPNASNNTIVIISAAIAGVAAVAIGVVIYRRKTKMKGFELDNDGVVDIEKRSSLEDIDLSKSKKYFDNPQYEH